MSEDFYPLTPPDRLSAQVQDSTWLVSLMVTVLRQYFGTTDRLPMSRATLQWDPDPAASRIQIDVVDNLVYAESNQYPKILVDLESQQFPKEVIGDVANFDQQRGTVSYLNRRTSAFSVECWGLRKMESRAIADEVFFFIQSYRQIIMRQYGFAFLRVAQMPKPVRYPQYDDYWIARVLVEFEKDLHWGITPEALKMSNINIGVRQS